MKKNILHIAKRIAKITAIILAIAATGWLSITLFLKHPMFGAEIDPTSKRAERMAKAPNYSNGVFHNLDADPAPKVDQTKQSTLDRLLNFYDILFVRSKITRPKAPVNAIKTDIKKLHPYPETLVWFGHSTYFLQTAGKRIMIDPVLERAAPFAFLNKPFEGTSIYSPDDIPMLDYIILTHDHWDHLDYYTIKKLMSRTKKFICPLGVGAHLEHWGVKPEKITELYWNETISLDEIIQITALPARHYTGRLFDRNRTLWCGYMIHSNGRNIYLSGDTGYGTHIKDIAQRFPQIDFAILENGQYDMEWRHIHFVPEDLVRAIKELKPTNFITSHNSKFAMARHTWDDPLKTIYNSAQEHNLPLIYPQIGEPIILGEIWQGEPWW